MFRQPESPTEKIEKIEKIHQEIQDKPIVDKTTIDKSPSTIGNGNTVCQNCQTTTTPLWRRDESGQILCNACGLFLKLHGRRRPISLKTDVIKSRNRSRNNSNRQHRQAKISAHTLHIPINHSPSFLPTLSPHQHQYHHQHHHHHNSTNNSDVDHLYLSPNLQAISTPSTVFSYPNSPILGPRYQHQHVYTHHHFAGTKSVPSSTAVSPGLPPTVNGSGLNNILPPPRALLESATNSPNLGPIVLPSISSLNTRSNSNKASSAPKVRSIKTPPTILTPQSRPHSPTIPNNTNYRRVLSEQLRPSSPPDGIDRIPPLRVRAVNNHATANTQPSSSTSTPIQLTSDKTTREQLISTNQVLHSRVTELELVNDMLQTRIQQLESSEQVARQSETALRQSELMLRNQVQELHRLVDELKRNSPDTTNIKRLKVSELI